MSKEIRLDEISDVFEQVLQSGGEVAFVTSGTSMFPMLRNRKDKVFLVRLDRKLKKNDVPLVRMKDSGQFILHRVIGKNSDGYILRGDNRWENEYGITQEDVIAVVRSFERDGKKIKCSSLKYKLYCLLLPVIRNGRKYFFKCTDKLFAIRAKLLKKNHTKK